MSALSEKTSRSLKVTKVMLALRGKRFDAFMIQEQSEAALAHITNKTSANASDNGAFVGHTLSSCTGTTLKRTAQNRW